MKKQYLTTILVLAAIAIWGTVIVKVSKDLQPNAGSGMFVKVVDQISKETWDNYQLSDYVEDPFLRIIQDTSTISVPDSMPKKPIVVKEAKIIELPQYLGVLQHAGHQIALLKWHGKVIHIHKGEVVNGIKLTDLRGDSIKVKLSGAAYTLYMKKSTTITN